MNLIDRDNAGFPKTCILFATADWDEPYWTNKQHTAKSLADLGLLVLYVESVGLRTPKVGSARDWQRLRKRLIKGVKSLIFGASEAMPGIYVLSPLAIPAGHRYGLLRLINRFLLQLSIRRSLWGKDFARPLVWTYHPFMLEALPKAMESDGILYHCVDDLAALPDIDKNTFRDAEVELLRRADIVFVTAPALVAHCKEINPDTHLLPNVVDIDNFGQARQPGPILSEFDAIPEPRIGFHGVLSDFKIDFKLLLNAARMRAQWHWVFVGEEREGQKSPFVEELARLPNVHFLGYKSYKELPKFLRGIQVGLLPALLNDYTRSMFPMKYFEYIAAGLPVVATPLDALLSTNAAHVAFGGGEIEFCKAIEKQLEQGRLSSSQIEEAVGENTWRSRSVRMLNLLEKRHEERR